MIFKRSWIVLRRHEYPNGALWEQRTVIDARTSEQAIAKSALYFDVTVQGEYIAIPLSWWRIRRVPS